VFVSFSNSHVAESIGHRHGGVYWLYQHPQQHLQKYL
jgi:hypothetical protein